MGHSRIGGFRYKTRHKLQKTAREKGKVSLTRMFQEFKVGERVKILQEPAIHNGMPHPRFKNNVGTVVGQRGEAYVLEMFDGNKKKQIISLPIHLRKA